MNNSAIRFLKMLLGNIKEKNSDKEISVWKFINNKIVDSYSKNDYITEYSAEEFHSQIKEMATVKKAYKIIDLNEEGNFIVFSKGYSKEEIEIDLYLPLHFYQGERLKNRVRNIAKNKLERKKIVDKIYDYCINDDYENMLTLYGLRRTGKTVAMYHIMKRLLDDNKENIGYILLDECVSLNSLCRFIREQTDKNNIHYWFLDEITLVPQFVNDGKDLYDIVYGESKTIIAGTDSFIFSKVAEDELYDRLIFINTTNIDYKEYHELLPKDSYLDFIRFGGTFSPDEFYTQEKVNKYIETSITENLIHTLDNLYVQNLKDFSQIYGWKNNNKLNQAIEQVIKNENNELVESILMQEFKSELPLIIKNLKKDHDKPIDLTGVFPKIKINKIDEELKKRLKLTDVLKEEDIGNQAIKQLQTFLRTVHVLRIYEKHYDTTSIDAYLMRLSGLRYNQTNELIKTLLNDNTFISLSSAQKNALLERLKETVEGFLIEHNILNTLLDIVENNTKPGQTNNLEITQVRKDYIVNNNIQGREIDIVIINKEKEQMDLYEVKRNDNFEENDNFWAKWLIDQEFNRDLELKIMGYKIRNRYLLYLGKNNVRDLNQLKEKDEFLANYNNDLPIIYMRNIEEYLLNLKYDNIWKNE